MFKQIASADIVQRLEHQALIHLPRNIEKTLDRQWQGTIDMQFLRHVTDFQLRLAPYIATGRLYQPQYHPYQCGLACPVGPDQCGDAVVMQAQADALQRGLLVELYAHLIKLDQVRAVLSHACAPAVGNWDKGR